MLRNVSLVCCVTDDSDDEEVSTKKTKKGKGKLDGPPVMFLTPVDKKTQVIAIGA